MSRLAFGRPKLRTMHILFKRIPYLERPWLVVYPIPLSCWYLLYQWTCMSLNHHTFYVSRGRFFATMYPAGYIYTAGDIPVPVFATYCRYGTMIYDVIWVCTTWKVHVCNLCTVLLHSSIVYNCSTTVLWYVTHSIIRYKVKKLPSTMWKMKNDHIWVMCHGSRGFEPIAHRKTQTTRRKNLACRVSRVSSHRTHNKQ